MVTVSPFFHLFFIANFCLFCQNGKSPVVTAQPFFLLPPRVITIYYAGNPYLSYGTKIILPPRILPSTQFPPPCLSPPPSAPGGGGDPGHSGRPGKLYLATQAARDAAARRKEDRVNVLLSLPSLAPPSTPLNRATCYKKCSDEKSLSEAPPATIIPGERIIFDELTAVAKTPFESLPPVVASPALQQPTGVKLPALLQFELPAIMQFPIGVLNTQPPTVDKSPMQVCDALLSTAAGNDRGCTGEF